MKYYACLGERNSDNTWIVFSNIVVTSQIKAGIPRNISLVHSEGPKIGHVIGLTRKGREDTVLNHYEYLVHLCIKQFEQSLKGITEVVKGTE